MQLTEIITLEDPSHAIFFNKNQINYKKKFCPFFAEGNH